MNIHLEQEVDIYHWRDRDGNVHHMAVYSHCHPCRYLDKYFLGQESPHFLLPVTNHYPVWHVVYQIEPTANGDEAEVVSMELRLL